jgi:hypothetical protein
MNDLETLDLLLSWGRRSLFGWAIKELENMGQLPESPQIFSV